MKINEMTEEYYSSARKKFVEHNPSAKHDNVYIIQSVDMDGNVVDEKYGLNVLTDYGLNRLYLRGNTFHQVCIGTGKTLPTLEDTALTEPVAWQTGEESLGVNYGPVEYDGETHLMSVSECNYYRSYFDYGINTEPIEIWELGCGDSWNIYVHAVIYDKDGQQTYISKDINQRLYVTIYFTFSINTDMIESLYDKGVYCVLNPLQLARGNYDDTLYMSRWMMASNRLYRYRSYPIETLSGNKYRSILESHIAGTSNEFISNKSLIQDSKAYIDSFVFGYSTSRYQTNTYPDGQTFHEFMFTMDELEEDDIEEIEYDYIYTNNFYSGNYDSSDDTYYGHMNDYSLSNMFGYLKHDSDNQARCQGDLPMLQLHMTSLNMYNYISKKWDIPVQYVDAPDTRYNRLWAHLRCVIMFNLDGNNTTMYVYVNPFTNYRIKAFNNSSIRLYASDTYWDTSTWTLITNVSNIDPSLGSKRYYICAQDDVSLNPIYADRDEHHVIPTNDEYCLNDKCALTYGINKWPYYQTSHGDMLSSDKYEYLVTSREIVYPDAENGPIVYDLFHDGEVGLASGWRYMTENEDRFIIFDGPNDRRVDITYTGTHNDQTARTTFWIFDPTDNTAPPTYQKVVMDFQDSTVGYNPLVSWSDKGFLVSHRINDNKNDCVIVNVYGNDDGVATQTYLSDCRFVWAINPTNYCVYLDMSNVTDSKIFRVYDMSTNSVYQSFELPTDRTWTVTGLMGYGELIYVWATDSSSTKYCYIYNIGLQRLTEYTSAPLVDMIETYNCFRFNNTSSIDNYTYTSNDDCIIAIGTNYQLSSWIFRASDPSVPIRLLNDSNPGRSQTASSNNSGGRYPHIKKSLDGKQLWLSYAGFTRHVILDLGWILDNGTYERYCTRDNGPNCGGELSGGIAIYKDGAFCAFNGDYATAAGLNNKIWWYPIEAFSRMKITGTTRTITAFNNPFSISNKGITWKISNDINRVLEGE